MDTDSDIAKAVILLSHMMKEKPLMSVLRATCLCEGGADVAICGLLMQPSQVNTRYDNPISEDMPLFEVVKLEEIPKSGYMCLDWRKYLVRDLSVRPPSSIADANRWRMRRRSTTNRIR